MTQPTDHDPTQPQQPYGQYPQGPDGQYPPYGQYSQSSGQPADGQPWSTPQNAGPYGNYQPDGGTLPQDPNQPWQNYGQYPQDSDGQYPSYGQYPQGSDGQYLPGGQYPPYGQYSQNPGQPAGGQHSPGGQHSYAPYQHDGTPPYDPTASGQAAAPPPGASAAGYAGYPQAPMPTSPPDAFGAAPQQGAVPPQQGAVPSQAFGTAPQQGHVPSQAFGAPPQQGPIPQAAQQPSDDYKPGQSTPIPLSLSTITLRNGMTRSMVVSNVVVAGFAVACLCGAVWNLVTDEGTIGGAIALLVIGLLVGLVFVYTLSLRTILDAQGIHMGAFTTARSFPWPASRTSFFVRVTKSGGRARFISNGAQVYFVDEDGQPIPMTGLSWRGPSTTEMETKAVLECTRIWQWAVARGYTQETGQYIPLKRGVGLLQSMREAQEGKYGLR